MKNIGKKKMNLSRLTCKFEWFTFSLLIICAKVPSLENCLVKVEKGFTKKMKWKNQQKFEDSLRFPFFFGDQSLCKF
jgi:hypothetical protein